MIIATSSYKDYTEGNLIPCSISGDRGKKENFNGKYYKALAPKLSFWQIWESNIGLKDEDNNNLYYVEQFFLQVLYNLNPEEVYNELLGNVLLCYENNNEFCHRHIVAYWLEMLLDVEIPEIKVINGEIKQVERPLIIKKMLERTFKKYIYMDKFTSIRAWYVNEKAKKYDEAAKRKERENKNLANVFREQAADLRCSAEVIEKEYRGKILKK